MARRAGVSQTAASFVLTGRREKMSISAEVEFRVMQVAQETGYRPNIVSRSLRTGTTHTIGFISDTIATTLSPATSSRARSKQPASAGYLLLIAETEGDESSSRTTRDNNRPRGRRNRAGLDVHPKAGGSEGLSKIGPSVLLNAVPASTRSALVGNPR